MREPRLPAVQEPHRGGEDRPRGVPSSIRGPCPHRHPGGLRGAHRPEGRRRARVSGEEVRQRGGRPDRPRADRPRRDVRRSAHRPRGRSARHWPPRPPRPPRGGPAPPAAPPPPRRVGGRPGHVMGDRVLVATGSRPTIPLIPGLDTVPYLTSDLLDADEAARLTELPASLIVLGGGYVAVELAQMFSRLGSRVTMIARSGL